VAFAVVFSRHIARYRVSGEKPVSLTFEKAMMERVRGQAQSRERRAGL